MDDDEDDRLQRMLWQLIINQPEIYDVHYYSPKSPHSYGKMTWQKAYRKCWWPSGEPVPRGMARS